MSTGSVRMVRQFRNDEDGVIGEGLARSYLADDTDLDCDVVLKEAALHPPSR